MNTRFELILRRSRIECISHIGGGGDDDDDIEWVEWVEWSKGMLGRGGCCAHNTFCFL